jgi:uncharacterized membrane protein YeaQ/YmgE (transglycosylase-associated protein family)
MMGILGWVIFGFAVGLIARALLPGDDTLGVIGTTALGIVGALIGGWSGQALGWYRPGQGAGFVSATVGSILVLGLRRVWVTRRDRKKILQSWQDSEARRDRAA